MDIKFGKKKYKINYSFNENKHKSTLYLNNVSMCFEDSKQKHHALKFTTFILQLKNILHITQLTIQLK